MKRSLVTVVKPTASAFSVGKHRQMWLPWMISISMVHASFSHEPVAHSAQHIFSALGISDEVERYGLKGNKKKKSKQLDEDYVVS
jgi:hypothetical protein